MSAYGEEWRETEDGDILPPDTIIGTEEGDSVDYDALVDAATAFVNAEDEPSKNYVLEQSIALEYGAKYYETAALIKQSLEKSKDGGFSAGREIFFNDQWIPAARFASGELYRLRGRGELTLKGFNELWELLGMPAQPQGAKELSVPTPKTPSVEVPSHDEDEETDNDYGKRHVYKDAAKAAANDY